MTKKFQCRCKFQVDIVIDLLFHECFLLIFPQLFYNCFSGVVMSSVMCVRSKRSNTPVNDRELLCYSSSSKVTSEVVL